MCLETLKDVGNEGFKYRNRYGLRRAGFPLLTCQWSSLAEESVSGKEQER